MMHRELVERRRWITEERFLHALNYCMLLPGPEAQQLATYIGWLLHKTRGGLAAGGLFVLPSAVLLGVLSYIYAMYGNVSAVLGVLAGFKPVVVAVVIEAVIKIGRRALRQRMHFAIAAGAFIAIYVWSVPFPLVVLVAGLAGLAAGRTEAQTPAGPEARTAPSRVRLLKIAGAGAGLWAIPFVVLVAIRGWSSTHAEEYRFFTFAALVTFGGAYAVLAYVTQVVVESYGWITKSQAVDGLALAETTPGPLIMVLQFIGFMAAWNRPEGLAPLQSAVVGAAITTYTTFLPSFLFIFLGAPYIEVLRGNRNLTAALSGITAAVVGVILNLALVFGYAVFWPGRPDWFSIALAAAAFVALYHFHVNVIWVILAAGVLGVFLS